MVAEVRASQGGPPFAPSASVKLSETPGGGAARRPRSSGEHTREVAGSGSRGRKRRPPTERAATLWRRPLRPCGAASPTAPADRDWVVLRVERRHVAVGVVRHRDPRPAGVSLDARSARSDDVAVPGPLGFLGWEVWTFRLDTSLKRYVDRRSSSLTARPHFYRPRPSGRWFPFGWGRIRNGVRTPSRTGAVPAVRPCPAWRCGPPMIPNLYRMASPRRTSETRRRDSPRLASLTARRSGVSGPPGSPGSGRGR